MLYAYPSYLRRTYININAYCFIKISLLIKHFRKYKTTFYQ